MTETFRELIISRRELVYVLNALQTERIVGVDLEEFELPDSDFAALLAEAEDDLIASGLLTVAPETQDRELDPILVAMVGALAFRRIAFVLIRGVRGKGQQLFIFNFYQDIIIEHTQPKEGLHRLAVIEDLDAFLKRVDKLVPLHTVIAEDRPQFTIDRTDFEKLEQNIEDLEDSTISGTLMRAGLEPELTRPFIQALRNPILTFSIAFLHCEHNTAVSASSVAIFADEDSAWGVWGGIEGVTDTDYMILPTGLNDVKAAMIDWLDVEIT